MPESDLHRTLKNVACRWLFACGYAAIAQEVEIPGVGIIDAAASGKWKRYNPRAVDYDRVPQVDRCHAVFVECKAFRSDFLRDQGRQNQFAFALAERKQSLRRRSTHRHLYASAALGKFDTCLMRPHAHMHYILTPPRLLKVEEVPRRWGWLVYEDNRVRIVRKAIWQEVVNVTPVEGAIARALTARMDFNSHVEKPARREFAMARASKGVGRQVDTSPIPQIFKSLHHSRLPNQAIQQAFKR